MTRSSSLLLAALLAGCHSTDAPAPSAGLDARAVLVRASLDVRGTRPTVDEIARLERDAGALPAMLDALVDDPRFGGRVGDLFADAIRTRRDKHIVFKADDYGLAPSRRSEFDAAIAEEPIHIVSRVAGGDHPFSEVVTADYTIVDPILLETWPLERVEPQPADVPPGLVMARYTDGRPPAGIIATNAFMWRFPSTIENAQRGRANAVSRTFLCEDYLDRPIDFPKDVNLTDSDSIHHAIKTNGVCQACHATLDPFASHLWGFVVKGDDAITWSFYRPDQENGWQQTTGAAPAYFGVPTAGKADGLARAIAADTRFASCAVKRVYEGLLGRPAAVADEGQLGVHQDAFVASGLSMKKLVRSVLDDPAYRGIAARSVRGGDPAPVASKLVAPDLLASSFADLGGYAMTFDGRDGTRLDSAMRALAGGSDRGADSTPSAGRALVQRRLAEAEARALVSGLVAGSRAGALLASMNLASSPRRADVAALILEIASRRVDPASEEVTALLDLYDATAVEGAAEAWTALITALFADPTIATY